MGIARLYHGCTVMQNLVYVVGGYQGQRSTEILTVGETAYTVTDGPALREALASKNVNKLRFAGFQLF